MESLRPDATGHAERASDLPSLAIRRPWLVVVINLLIVIAGLAAWMGVEVRELPNIDRPIVAVRADFPGAAPETLDAEVTRVVEGAAARVPGVVLVRSAAKKATSASSSSSTPAPTSSPPPTTCATPWPASRAAARGRGKPHRHPRRRRRRAGDAAGGVEHALSVQELSRLVEDQIEPAGLVAVPGVADVTLFGQRQRTLRVRLDRAHGRARRGPGHRGRCAGQRPFRRARRQPGACSAGRAGARQPLAGQRRPAARAAAGAGPAAGRRGRDLRPAGRRRDPGAARRPRRGQPGRGAPGAVQQRGHLRRRARGGRAAADHAAGRGHRGGRRRRGVHPRRHPRGAGQPGAGGGHRRGGGGAVPGQLAPGHGAHGGHSRWRWWARWRRSGCWASRST
jgi:hypothetical protein